MTEQAQAIEAELNTCEVDLFNDATDYKQLAEEAARKRATYDVAWAQCGRVRRGGICFEKQCETNTKKVKHRYSHFSINNKAEHSQQYGRVGYRSEQCEKQDNTTK